MEDQTKTEVNSPGSMIPGTTFVGHPEHTDHTPIVSEVPQPSLADPLKSRHPKHGLIILLLIIFNAAVMGVAYAVITRSIPKRAAIVVTTPHKVAPETSTLTYTSKLGVKFTYPTDWTVEDSKDDLIISSPVIYYMGRDNTEANNFKSVKVRGMFKIRINRDLYFGGYGKALADSLPVQFPSPFESAKTGFIDFGGETAGFTGYRLSFGTPLKKGDKLPENNKMQVYVTGGYFNQDAVHQDASFDPADVNSYRNPPEFSKSLDIIRSLHQ